MEDAAKSRAELVVIAALLVPVLVKVTAPVILLFWVSVIALAPALNKAVPGTTKAPVCVIAPPAVADNDPPLFKVKAGKAIPALAKLTVRLRRVVREVKLVGNVAAALIFVRLTSKTLFKVAPAAKLSAPLRLLA